VIYVEEEGNKMEKLEHDINELMNKINQSWVNAIEEATKNNTALDMTKMFGKYSGIVAEKEKAFQDAKIRLSKPKNKGWF